MPMLPSDIPEGLVGRLPGPLPIYAPDMVPATWTTNFTIEISESVSAAFQRLKERLDKAIRYGEVLGREKPHIIYNPQAGMTIMIFSDGEKIISKTTKDDAYDPEVGVAMCLVKRIMSRSAFKRLVKSGKWMDNATS